MELRAALGLVEEFHRTFRLPVGRSPTAALATELINTRVKLFEEELEEYRQAAEAGDLVEVADALVDMLYVLLGTFVSHGLQSLAEEMLAEVHRSNMSKLDDEGHPIVIDGKVRKSSAFREPHLAAILSSNLRDQ